MAHWPLYAKVMAPIRCVLLAEIDTGCYNFRRQLDALGPHPTEQPPTELALEVVRRRLAPAVGLTAQEIEAHHPASPWRYNLVRVLTAATDDDPHIWRWLRDGAPYRERSPSGTGRAVAAHLRGAFLNTGGAGGNGSGDGQSPIL